MRKYLVIVGMILVLSLLAGCEDNTVESSVEDVAEFEVKNEVKVDDNTTLKEVETFDLDYRKIPDRRVFWSNNKVGYIDRDGNVVIAPTFAYGKPFEGEYAIVGSEYVYSPYNLGLIDKQGNIIIELKYDTLKKSTDQSYIGTIDKTEYLLSTNGTILYEGDLGFLFNTGTFVNNFAPIYDGQKYGAINEDGEIIVELKYDYISPMNNSKARVMYTTKDKYGVDDIKEYAYIDRDGNVVLGPYQFIDEFHEGVALVKIDDFYGYVDLNGEIVIDPQYKEAMSFHEGIAFVDEDGDGKFGAININGETIFSEKFKNADYFYEGRAIVTNDFNTPLIINVDGDVIYKAEKVLMDIGHFSNGLAVVSHGKVLEKKFGYMDYDGNVVIPFDFDEAQPFVDGVANVKIGETWFSIDLAGMRVGHN